MLAALEKKSIKKVSSAKASNGDKSNPIRFGIIPLKARKYGSVILVIEKNGCA